MIMHDTPTTQSIVPSPENGRLLRDAFGRFATGVTIVTTDGPEGAAAIVANSFSSVSIEPALVLWSVAHSSRRYPIFRDATSYAIHVLAADQNDVCDAVCRDAYALRDAPTGMNGAGVPLIDGCLARFECRQSARHAAGDHDIIVGAVERFEMTTGQPLAFFAGTFGQIAQ